MKWPLLRRRPGADSELNAPTAGERTAPSPKVLRELGPEEMFGTAEIRAEDPDMHREEEVLFVPLWYREDWGVFDPGGQPVEAALDFVFPWRQPVLPPTTCAVSWSEVERTLPDADYLYLGFIHFHFGHFVTDSLSRIWPLLENGPAGRKLLYHGFGNWESWCTDAPWLPEMLRSLGVHESDLLHITEPVRVRRLLVPGRSWQGQTFAHQVHQRVCRKIGERLLDGVRLEGGPPAYLSKSRMAGGVRRVTNEPQLEAFLRPRGVEVLYPETMSTPDKIALFASGRTVTGTTSSAFNLRLFAPAVGRLVALETDPEVNSTHRIVDRLTGDVSTYLHPLGARRVPEEVGKWMDQYAFPDPVAVGRELMDWL